MENKSIIDVLGYKIEITCISSNRVCDDFFVFILPYSKKEIKAKRFLGVEKKEEASNNLYKFHSKFKNNMEGITSEDKKEINIVADDLIKHVFSLNNEEIKEVKLIPQDFRIVEFLCKELQDEKDFFFMKQEKVENNSRVLCEEKNLQ